MTLRERGFVRAVKLDSSIPRLMRGNDFSLIVQSATSGRLAFMLNAMELAAVEAWVDKRPRLHLSYEQPQIQRHAEGLCRAEAMITVGEVMLELRFNQAEQPSHAVFRGTALPPTLTSSPPAIERHAAPPA